MDARGSKASPKSLHIDTEWPDLPDCINLSAVQNTISYFLIYSGEVFTFSPCSPAHALGRAPLPSLTITR